MNKNKNIIVVCIGVLMLVMLIYPPFQGVRESTTFNLGYGFIWSPPGQGNGNVNVGLLFMQWMVVFVAGVIAWIFVKDKN